MTPLSERLRGLWEKATQGEWRLSEWKDEKGNVSYYIDFPETPCAIFKSSIPAIEPNTFDQGDTEKADMELTAALHNALPAILEALRDQERYRFIRDNDTPQVDTILHSHGKVMEELIDRAIDTALSSGGGKEK